MKIILFIASCIKGLFSAIFLCFQNKELSSKNKEVKNIIEREEQSLRALQELLKAI